MRDAGGSCGVKRSTADVLDDLETQRAPGLLGDNRRGRVVKAHLADALFLAPSIGGAE
jgi:hypothetical protein